MRRADQGVLTGQRAHAKSRPAECHQCGCRRAFARCSCPTPAPEPRSPGPAGACAAPASESSSAPLRGAKGEMGVRPQKGWCSRNGRGAAHAVQIAAQPMPAPGHHPTQGTSSHLVVERLPLRVAAGGDGQLRQARHHGSAKCIQPRSRRAAGSPLRRALRAGTQLQGGLQCGRAVGDTIRLQHGAQGSGRAQPQVRHQRRQQALEAGFIQEACRAASARVIQEAAVQRADDLGVGRGEWVQGSDEGVSVSVQVCCRSSQKGGNMWQYVCQKAQPKDSSHTPRSTD